jgi:glycosyltransferase involved in cell wall biosynthesis
MRVLHITETVVGGVGSHLAELLPLQRRDFGPGAVTLIYPHQMQDHFPAIAGVNTVLFEHCGNRGRATRELARAVRVEATRERPDIIHAHSSFAGLASRLPLLGAFGDVPVVYCPHGWSFAQDVSWAKTKLYASIERLLLYRTACVINVSEHEKALAVSMGLSATKMTVIRNGIVAKMPALGQEDHCSLPELAPDKLHLLFVGRLDRQKGIDVLVDAARALENESVHFHVIGAPVRAGECPIPKNLTSLTNYGWRSRDFVFAMLNRVDALVMPSRWEGMPMIGLEAFRAGIPIIGSNKSAMPELIEDGVSGLMVDIDQSGALAACIRGLSKTSLIALGNGARDRFISSFTIERQHSAIKSLYSTLTP